MHVRRQSAASPRPTPALGFRELVAEIPRPEPGRRGDPGLFGPGSLVWRVNGETATILGGGRALLMQLAHPIVAAGVADHSGFRQDAFARLWRTLDAVLTIVFGDTAQAEAAAAEVNRIHARVRGERDGVPYRATDPDLLLWVHATLVDSALVCFRTFVGPLERDETDRYVAEMTRFAELFGVPPGTAPSDLGSFECDLADRIAKLRVSDEARRLADEIVRPPVAATMAPASALFRVVTVGLLPEPLRAGFGLELGPAGRLGLRAATSALRRTIPLLPANIRRWPHARAAQARV
jgi:uncharacterized protein (DUF2236 family)